MTRRGVGDDTTWGEVDELSKQRTVQIDDRTGIPSFMTRVGGAPGPYYDLSLPSEEAKEAIQTTEMREKLLC
jgi:hypothetical protein